MLNRHTLPPLAAMLLIANFGLLSCDNATPPDGAPRADVAPAPKPEPAPPAEAPREGWPTAEQAKAAIHKFEHSIHANSTKQATMHVSDMRHEVQSVTFGDTSIKRVMEVGAAPVMTYPTRILYTRITEYTNKPDKVEECGTNGVWYLYRNGFGEWLCKFGN